MGNAKLARGLRRLRNNCSEAQETIWSALEPNLLSSVGTIRTLHLNWFAFFPSFLVWFSHALLMASIQDTFGLSTQKVKTLLIMNVALAIQAHVIIGMRVDKFGPQIIIRDPGCMLLLIPLRRTRLPSLNVYMPSKPQRIMRRVETTDHLLTPIDNENYFPNINTPAQLTN